MSLLLNIHCAFATSCKNLFFSKKSLVFFLFGLVFVLPIHAGILDKSVTEESKFEANDLYQALAAEFYNEIGDQNQAVDFYYSLSASNNDPAIAKRVTELATATGQISKALNAAERWVEISPNNLEANQYLALLFIRNGHFTSAAKRLDSIRVLIEETSDKLSEIDNEQFQTNESLTFIGAMLTAESHHKKAYTVFNIFIKNHFSKVQNHSIYDKQRKLIAAQLAMKAKKYTDVVAYLEDLTGLDGLNHVDAKVMHAKALHKLRKNDLAITQLKDIQNHADANDSHRLELVRLLVLNRQKDAALPILKKLVSKHSKNFELLKSYIALQIDQSNLSNVESNIKLLGSQGNYINEVAYFRGEFAEKLGQQEKALRNYAKVNGGSYLKNAHKKTISLTKKVEGKSALKEFFKKKQNNAKTIKTQAYWIKLQADELFEAFNYEEALSLYNKAITLAPKKTRYRYKRGLVNERLGYLENAETDFNYVLSIRENDYEVLNAFGYMLSVHTDRISEAKSYIDRAFELKPNDPLVLDSLGFVLYKKGELDQAEKYLRKSFNIMKKPEVASHLITVLAELEQYQEAKNIYLEMQKIYPNSPSLKSVAHRIQ